MDSKNGHYSRQWSRDVERLSRTLDIELGAVFQKIVLDALSGVAEATPRDTGLAQASWMSDIDTPDETVNTDPNRDSVAEGASVFEELRVGDTAIISNNLVYIEALDAGSSTQAPSGIVQNVLTKLDKAFELESDIE